MGNDAFPVGKLPIDLLEKLLAGLKQDDPNLLVGPGIGVDAAVVSFGGQKLVFKTDPITFTSERLPWHVVTINGNDIACMGATPRYLLATFLLPEGRTTPSMVEGLFGELRDACLACGITLAGGHTEITHGLDRPLAIGFMIGTLDGRDFIRPAGMRPGDAVLLSKRIPIEAVAVIASERGGQLGIGDDALARAKNLVRDPGISIVTEAALARDSGFASAMHDPTEGGLATGLRELARAGGCGMRIHRDRIPVLDLAAGILPLFSMNPLGTLASGSLIVCCRSEGARAILDAWARAGIEGSIIGEVTGEPDVLLVEDGIARPLPEFPADEIAKIYAKAGQG